MSVPETTKNSAPAAGETSAARAAAEALHRAAWLSVGLGLLVEIAVLVVLFLFGELSDTASEVADAVQRISWPVLVCVALAFAQVTSEAVGAHPARSMGVAGLVAAPLALALTRAAQKGLAAALGATQTGLAIEAILILSAVRAAQYGTLGGVIGWLQRRRADGPGIHVAVGLAVGIVFGGIALTATVLGDAAPESTGEVIADAINEVFVPVGCALILFATKALAGRIKPA